MNVTRMQRASSGVVATPWQGDAKVMGLVGQLAWARAANKVTKSRFMAVMDARER